MQHSSIRPTRDRQFLPIFVGIAATSSFQTLISNKNGFKAKILNITSQLSITVNTLRFDHERREIWFINGSIRLTDMCCETTRRVIIDFLNNNFYFSSNICKIFFFANHEATTTSCFKGKIVLKYHATSPLIEKAKRQWEESCVPCEAASSCHERKAYSENLEELVPVTKQTGNYTIEAFRYR